MRSHKRPSLAKPPDPRNRAQSGLEVPGSAHAALDPDHTDSCPGAGWPSILGWRHLCALYTCAQCGGQSIQAQLSLTFY